MSTNERGFSGRDRERWWFGNPDRPYPSRSSVLFVGITGGRHYMIGNEGFPHPPIRTAIPMGGPARADRLGGAANPAEYREYRAPLRRYR